MSSDLDKGPTLWDLLQPLWSRVNDAFSTKPAAQATRPIQAVQPASSPSVTRPKLPARPKVAAQISQPTKRPKARSESDTSASMQEKYDAVVRHMLTKYQIRVRKWRSNMSGIAWYVTYRDGRVQRLIESPRPKGPMSVAIFLHEIGHHAIGFDVYKPRCLEEFHAWRWAIEAMAEHGLNITEPVLLRQHRSLHYAIGKAVRRGIKTIPGELEPFLAKPPTRSRRTSLSKS